MIGTLVVLVTFSAASQAQPDNWQLAYEGENLLVQRRDYPDSALDEIRGVIKLKASLNSLMALLVDAQFNDQWVFRSGGARILQQEDYAQAYVYGVVDAPWPMQDRDSVVRFDYRQEAASKAITITITNFPDFIAPKEKLVRVPRLGGHWGLKPEQDGWVEVTYQVYGDPGGWIPSWIANRAAVLSVQHTLINMESAVGHYENVQSEFVEEVALSRLP